MLNELVTADSKNRIGKSDNYFARIACNSAAVQFELAVSASEIAFGRENVTLLKIRKLFISSSPIISLIFP